LFKTDVLLQRYPPCVTSPQIAMQAQRSMRTSDGRHMLLPDPPGYLQFDSPTAVVREVRKVFRYQAR
jgi:hypothetical protein